MKKQDASLLYDTLKRGDLWMIKAIYLVLLIKSLGLDASWILFTKDKAAIYAAIERVGEKSNDTNRRV